MSKNSDNKKSNISIKPIINGYYDVKRKRKSILNGGYIDKPVDYVINFDNSSMLKTGIVIEKY